MGYGGTEETHVARMVYEEDGDEAVRVEAFPRENFIKGIEGIHKACGWRLDLRPIATQCSTLLKTVKENKNFVLEPITSEDSMILTTLLRAISSNYPPRLTEPALNYLHRLIAGGLVLGESGEKSEKKMVDVVVEKICDCGASSSEDVQLAVLKALLTICTSETFCVKGERLLQAFKMIFNLAVGSNFEAIKRCATASLQQLLSVWFRKAAADFSISQSGSTAGDGMDNDLDVANIANLAEKADINGLEKVLTKRLSKNFSQREGLMDSTDDGQSPMTTSVPPTPSQGSKRRARAVPLAGLEVDLFVLLRSLCRLAARTISQSTSDYFIIEGKLLALGLIKHVLQFQAWDTLSNRFIQRARNLLCVMLIRNANCSIDTAAVKQIEILSMIILQPRILEAMKPEAGAFMPLLIIRHLEVFSPEPHLLRAACSALCLLSSKEQLLVDLFVNYDCDMSATNVFDRIVKGLCYVIISKPTYDAATESKMKILACKALFQSLTGLRAWFTRQDQRKASGQEEGEGADANGESLESVSRQRDIIKAKSKKDSLSGGIDHFNARPVKGMKALINSGVLEGSVEAQAEFLYKTKGLSKGAKGEFFGHHEENQVAVMHKYTDYFDFAGMEFDQAMRFYLDTFRLPGEAQQIDRIMEKFADRYCTCNQGTFSNADQAYMLAYAIIMLNTDLHNPLAEHLMSKVDFIGMVNQSPGEGEDHETLPEEFLGPIFDRIAASQIKIHNDGDSKKTELENVAMMSPLMKVLKKALPFQRAGGEAAASQMQPSLEGIKDLLRKHQGQDQGSAGVWNTAENSEIAILMCRTICKHSMDIFDSLDKIKVSMDSFKIIIQCIKEAIIVTGMMDQKDVCDKLICTMSELVGFSEANTFTLTLPDSMRIEAFRSLANVALHHSALIRGSWTHVLRCLSRSQYFALQGSEMDVMRKFDRSGYDITYKNGAGKSDLMHYFEAEGLQFVDQLFSGSGTMDGQTIIMFVTSLCAVSREELEVPMFKGLELILLQRLVETVHHNLDRIRMVWSRLWAVTSAHLVGAGCEDTVEIAMYSIDALRQVVYKLLEHQELSNFKFQDEALKPFVSILRQSELNQVHIFAIQCILQIVSAHGTKLQSGWHSVLGCVKIALRNEAVDVIDAALHILKRSWSEPQIVSNEGLFNDLKACFLELMEHGDHVEHQSKAIQIVRDGGAQVLEDLSGRGQGLEIIDLVSVMGKTALENTKSCYHVAYQALFGLLGSPGLRYTEAKWEEVLEGVVTSSFVPGPDLSASDSIGQAEEYYKTYVPLLCKLVHHDHMPLSVVVSKVLGAIQGLVVRGDLGGDLKIFLIAQFSELADQMVLKEEAGEGGDAKPQWMALAQCAGGVLSGIQEAFEACEDGGEAKARLVEEMVAFQKALSDICIRLAGKRGDRWSEVQGLLLGALEANVCWARRVSTTTHEMGGSVSAVLADQEVKGGMVLIEVLREYEKKEDLVRVCTQILTNFDARIGAALAPLTASAVKALSLVDCPEEDLIHIVRNMVPHMEDHLEVRSAISEFLTKKILPPLERKFNI